MKRSVFAGILVAVAAALGAAYSASAAINPTFSVGVNGLATATATVEVHVGQSDDWVGRLQIYVPSGFKLNAPAGGAPVGAGQVTAIGTLVGPDQVFAMPAKITAIGATDPAVAFQTTHCDNVGHLAAWMVQARGGDDSWSFPIFVDRTTGTEATFGPYKLVLCFGPRSTGGNSEGNKLLGLSLALKVFVAPAKPADYRWRALLTPFAGDQSAQSGSSSSSDLNDAGSVEAQSISRLQLGRLTLTAKKTSRGRATLTGTLNVNGKPVPRATIALQHGSSKTKLVSLGNTKTNANGAFTKAVTLTRSSYFRAGTTLAKQDLGAGGCAASFGVPCLDATVGGTAFISNLLHLAGTG